MQKTIFELMKEALGLKLKHRGTKLGLCSIMNVKSGGCTEDCAFCAQSSHYSTDAPHFPMRSKDEIVRHAEQAKKLGAQRFSLVASGRGPTKKEVDLVAEAVSFIRERVDIRLCASLGIIGKDGLRTLKEAGITRYHHNIESSKRFFPRICTTHSFQERLDTVKRVLDIGLECCSGCIIGLGEDWEDREEMALTLKGLGVHSVPMNFLVPIRGTPLGDRANAYTDPLEAVKTVAIFRTILKTPAIRLCGGREQVLGDFMGMALMAGADALMIGGYLTTPGRDPFLDQRLTESITRLWTSML